MRYILLNDEISETMKIKKVFPDYLKMRCQICSSEWGVRLDPGRKITEKDLTCRNCLLEKLNLDTEET